MNDDKPLAKNEPRDPGRSGAHKRESASEAMSDTIGAHPIGTSVGAVGGIAAGAAMGMAAGPVGSLVGAAVGAIAGAVAGGGVGEMTNPDAHDDYWRQNFQDRPYVNSEYAYDDYGPAYRYGVEAYNRLGQERDWAGVETDLGADWQRYRGDSRLGWSDARLAAQDAWQRSSDMVERAIPGDVDRDGN